MMRTRKRQTIDLGSFQYRRSSSINQTKESVNPNPSRIPQPLEEQPILENFNQKENIPSPPNKKQTLPAEKEIAKKRRPHKRKTRHYHRQIQVDLPNENRLALLVNAMVQDYEQKELKNKSEEEHVQCQQAQQSLQVHFKKWSEERLSSASALAARTKVNQIEKDLVKSINRFQTLIKTYQQELADWEAVKDQLQNENLSWEKENCIPEIDVPKEFETLEELTRSSKDAVELHILRTDHMQTILKRLEGRSQDTHYRIQAVATALNDRIMREFGKKQATSKVTPFKRLEAGVLTQGKKD